MIYCQHYRFAYLNLLRTTFKFCSSLKHQFFEVEDKHQFVYSSESTDDAFYKIPSGLFKSELLQSQFTHFYLKTLRSDITLWNRLSTRQFDSECVHRQLRLCCCIAESHFPFDVIPVELDILLHPRLDLQNTQNFDEECLSDLLLARF